MKAKVFTLDLSAYEIEAPRQVIKEDKSIAIEVQKSDYPIRNNLSVWLRTIGIFKCGEDIAEAVSLAKQIRECKEDYLKLDGKPVSLDKLQTNLSK